MNDSLHMPYEGAGFLLTRVGHVVLGKRIKKESDLLKDSTIEVEYMGGKAEPEYDQNDPHRTARAELAEELGGDILQSDWKERAKVEHIFQPFSKKWIWCFRLELTLKEYHALLKQNTILRDWPQDEERNFKALTGRDSSCRKALDGIYFCSVHIFHWYLKTFHQTPTTNSGNRMKDAKEFGKTHSLAVWNPAEERMETYPLRGFNTVMFETLNI